MNTDKENAPPSRRTNLPFPLIGVHRCSSVVPSICVPIRRRPRWVAGVAIGSMAAAALAWVAWLMVGGGMVRDGLAWARGRMVEGGFAAARDRLARLSAWCPRDDEVALLLGECEAKLGRPEAALSAWGSVG